MKHIFFIALSMLQFFAQAQDTIVKQDLNVAAKIFDLEFSQSEIDTMYDAVKDLNKEVKKMHGITLPNSVQTSLVQKPVMAGVKLNTKQEAVNWNIPANVQIQNNKNDLAFYSILQLASLIKNKKITSVELTQFFIDRLKKYSDTLQCTISLTESIAMQEAQQADKEIKAGKYRGPLHGIPYGLKDLFAVKGTKTTWGAAPFKDQSVEEDAFVYTQLKKAGAVLVAKFTLGALAMGDKWYGGRTNNPWNLKEGSSGSSAGSAAATVAGLVPFAIGTETWGSIISPSTACGATGFRPTFGRVSRSGAMALSWSLDKIGPICRSAEDAAVVFNYIHGTDGKDVSAVNLPFNYKSNVDIKKMKIAYAKNYFDKLDSNSHDKEVLQTFRQLGANLIPVHFPEDTAYDFDIMGIIISVESAAQFDELTRSNLDDQLTAQTKNDWPNQFRASRFISAVDYLNATRHRFLLMQKVNEFINEYDVVICPTWGGNQNAITNLTGNPAICFPTGFNEKNLPASITLVGKLYDEGTLLALAKKYQDVTKWNKQHPPMF